MRARCGACGTTIEVPGAGRFQCPACGQLNEVRPPEGASEGQGGPVASPSPPPPDAPSPRLECPACSFTFIVGDVETATCPNCRAEVTVSSSDPGEDVSGA